VSGDVLRVGMVGYAFMGRAHAHAWRSAHRFFDLPRTPELTAIVGRDRAAVTAAADRLGFASAETDWRALLTRDDIELIDICTPGDSHAEIAIAALEAGKHVLCEKPLANTVDEAEQMAAAARAAADRGVWAMCGFSYRRTPALGLARELIEAGRIGTVRHVRANYLQDWLSDPDAPMTWRMDRAKAGSGALGDLGAHLIDTTQWLTGQLINEVSASMTTFVTSRPLSDGMGDGTAAAGDAPRGEVTVDDASFFTARFADGVLGTFEATRMALGRRNAFRIEINGTRGSLAFDFEKNNELEFFDGTEPRPQQGFRRILVTEPEHPYIAAWWPPGHGLGYEHGFTNQVADLVSAIAANRQPLPSFDDGRQVQRVLGAAQQSADNDSAWTTV
jgi:predicted dehydrogenase